MCHICLLTKKLDSMFTILLLTRHPIQFFSEEVDGFDNIVCACVYIGTKWSGISSWSSSAGALRDLLQIKAVQKGIR